MQKFLLNSGIPTDKIYERKKKEASGKLIALR